MRLIEQVTDDAAQKHRVELPDGSFFEMTMRYFAQQRGWFILELTHSTTGFTIRGLRITVNANMLYQWKNKLPFGLACFSNDNDREPMLQEDFASNAAALYVLDPDEVAALVDAYIDG